jgi:hypothetical protein
MNADPAAHIPSCRRDRCEKIDRSSVPGEVGPDGVVSSEAILGVFYDFFEVVLGAMDTGSPKSARRLAEYARYR